MSNAKLDPFGKDAIREILIQRDGMSFREATEHLEDLQIEVDESMSCCQMEDLDDLIREELGLEPDYLMTFLMREKLSKGEGK